MRYETWLLPPGCIRRTDREKQFAACERILYARSSVDVKLNHLNGEVATRPGASGHRMFCVMLLLCALAALAVVAPFAFLGNASGHDFEVHLASWMDVALQWRSGVAYPRWAVLANWGFGEPRFIFYPPASWMLGSVLSFVLPWRMIPGAFIWLALMLAGICMFILARQWLDLRQAVAAAMLFVLNPYHLVVVYWRSDFAELLASALMPLAVLFSMRTQSTSRRAFVPLALVTAAVWLCNAPAAVIASYTMAIILVIQSVHGRSLRPLLWGSGALAMGLGLAAFYIVPAAVEQSWVNIGEVIGQGLSFPENFLFTRSTDAEHAGFNFIVSWTAVAVIGPTLAALIANARWRRERPGLWWVTAVITLISIILMLPVSFVVWQYLPKLRYVQFPWRWLLVLDVPFALLLAAAIGKLRAGLRPAAWATALIALAITGFLLTRSNWWDPGGSKDFYETHFANGNGYFGLDEYGPRGSEHYNLGQHVPLISLRSLQERGAKPEARVQVRQHGPKQIVFTAHSGEPVIAAPRLLNYPAWRVEVNGAVVSTTADLDTGQMLIPLSPSTSRVQIRWIATPDVHVGEILSAIAAAVLLAVVFLRPR